MANEALAAHMRTKLTPEAIAKARARIGIRGAAWPFRASTVNYRNTESHPDTMRHFVHGYGDDNPMFIDPEYAKRTRWGELVAPLHYLQTVTVTDPDTPELSKADKEKMSGGDPLRGIHVFVSGTTSEWWRPICMGRKFYSQGAVVGVEEKRSQFAKAAVHQTRASVIRDDAGSLIAQNSVLTIHTERETAAKSGKYHDIERPQYTPEEIERIDDAYAKEFRRGADKLYWEDVEVGEALPTMVKGPLTITDIIFWHVGGNESSAYGLSPLRLAYKNRMKIPGFYLPNQFGAWDAAQSCHWDDWMAQASGNPYAYDYGAMRTSWLAHYVYNWMGDDAWMWKCHAEHRKFNYIGDTTWINGKVTGKFELEGPRFAVELDLWAENQRGDISSPGSATVLLPSYRQEEVLLPDPPGGATTVDEVFEQLILQHG